MAKTKPTPIKMSPEEKRWRTEDDLRTLQRAGEIQTDPARMNAVRKAAADLTKLVMGGATKSKPAAKKK
jgi:hypothetical protein